MGFDNECILNIQSLPGEYFCPVCRTLIYPTEALQTQCTHLYCKPCLAHTAATTQACPYDGYLVTEADSKPLIDLNKPLADLIGKVQVHCLYYRSSCPWQGTLSECVAHCLTCAYGNSPVLCNRCGTQIMHRQVQEHAQVCPVLPPQVSQPVEPTQAQAAAATSQYAGQNVYATPTATAAATGAPVPASTPGASGQAAGDQWYQQQYYQQYPGYDPYAQYTQQPQSQIAPFAMQPPHSQSAVPQMQAGAQNILPQPPHLQSQQLQQQPQPPQPQPIPQLPPFQPLPAPQSQLQLTPQGHTPTQSSVTGYSSYPQSQPAPTQQPHMQMLPPQQSLTPPPQGSYAPPPQQMAVHQQLQPMGPGTRAQQFGPPHAQGQALGAGVPPLGLNHGTPPPPQFQLSPPGSLRAADTTDETNGKINQYLNKGSDYKVVSNGGPIASRNTTPATLPHERYPPHGHLQDMPPYGQGQICMPHNLSARPYSEVPMRPSMANSPHNVPEAFDSMGWQPRSSFEPPYSGPGMVRSNGLHAPLHDEGLRSYHRQQLEGLSKYERSSHPSKQDEFYGPSAEYVHGPPPFRGGRHEYGGVSPYMSGADYERSRFPFNFPTPDGRSGAKRFGEPMGYRRYSGPGNAPPSGNYGEVFPGGKGSSIERSRKRSFLTVGWCRICKIDCGTAEGLDSHSQSKDHKKMALDMILSIKQQVSKNPKLLDKHEVTDVKDGSDEVEFDTTSRK